MKIDTKPMPSLSMDGWITSTSIKADYLISHFFVSEYSRTFLFEGEVASMPYLIQKHKNDILGLVRDVELTLKSYFGRYFPKAEVQVSSKEYEAGKYSLIATCWPSRSRAKYTKPNPPAASLRTTR